MIPRPIIWSEIPADVARLTTCHTNMVIVHGIQDTLVVCLPGEAPEELRVKVAARLAGSPVGREVETLKGI